MRNWMFLTFIFTGCLARPYRLPTQKTTDYLVKVVWNDEFKSEFPIPEITWEFGDNACLKEYQALCADGMFIYEENRAVVHWYGNYCQTAMVHELYHAYLGINNARFDINHSNRGWSTWVPVIEKEICELEDL